MQYSFQIPILWDEVLSYCLAERIRAHLQEVFFHDLVQSSTGLHNYQWNGAGPNTVLGAEGPVGSTCIRNKVTTKYTVRDSWNEQITQSIWHYYRQKSSGRPTCCQKLHGQRQALSLRYFPSHFCVLFGYEPDQPQQEVKLLWGHQQRRPEPRLILQLCVWESFYQDKPA